MYGLLFICLIRGVSCFIVLFMVDNVRCGELVRCKF
jgi:hypothetical protein